MPAPVAIRRSYSAEVRACSSSSPTVVPHFGAVEEFRYPIDHDRVQTGEVLLLSTEGITEAENGEHTLYTSERLAKALATVQVVDAQRVVAAVIDDVSRFVGGAEQADDMTLLALRRVAGAAA